MAVGSARCSRTEATKSSRTASTSQREAFKRRCIPSGVPSPASSASCQPFLRSAWLIDTPPDTSGRCSGDVCPNGLRSRLRGLPGPQDVERGVRVAGEDQATAWADVGPHGQALRHPFPTAAAVLAGRGGRNGFPSRASPCCLAREQRSEGIPARVVDRRVQASRAAGPVLELAAVSLRQCLGTADPMA
jgi:hypothetical protein